MEAVTSEEEQERQLTYALWCRVELTGSKEVEHTAGEDGVKQERSQVIREGYSKYVKQSSFWEDESRGKVIAINGINGIK